MTVLSGVFSRARAVTRNLAEAIRQAVDVAEETVIEVASTVGNFIRNGVGDIERIVIGIINVAETFVVGVTTAAVRGEVEDADTDGSA